jgi:Xaa-Pro dipeptidase
MLGENVHLATGHWPLQLAYAFVPQEGQATLLVPDWDVTYAAVDWAGDIRPFPYVEFCDPPTPEVIAGIFVGLAKEHGISGGLIGFEGSSERIAPPLCAPLPAVVAGPTQELIKSAFSTDRLADVSPVLEKIRSVKTDADVERLRVANEIAMVGLDAFKRAVRAGATEVEVRAAVDTAIVRFGHGYKGVRAVNAYPTVIAGRASVYGWRFCRSSDRVINDGDAVILEMATVSDGYWTDHTRTVVAGKATPRQKELWQTLVLASEAAQKTALPGALGQDVDAASRETCSGRGFTQFPHHSGHGVGFRYNEPAPSLTPKSHDPIMAGQVITIEPGIYSQELGGFRLENDFVITADGAAVLANNDLSLDA